MDNCRHTQWLRLLKHYHDVEIEISDRPLRLLDKINSNTPISLVAFIGNHAKSAALSSLNRRDKEPRKRFSHGELHLEVESLFRQEILIASGDLPVHGNIPRSSCQYKCHETITKPFERTSNRAIDHSHNIYHSIILPSADVICLFVDDIGGVTATMHHLSIWAKKGPPSASEYHGKILLVTRKGNLKRLQSELNLKLQYETGDQNAFFKLVRIHEVAGMATRKSRKQFHTFPRELSRLLAVQMSRRRKLNLLFSAQHVLEFLRISASNITKPRQDKLNFVKESRAFIPIAKDLDFHIVNLLKQFKDPDQIQELGVPFLASSLILDHYLPGMHCFDPALVFRELYQPPCSRAEQIFTVYREEANLAPIKPNLLSTIFENFIEKYSLFRKMKSAAALQRAQLRHLQEIVNLPPSEDICFSCIRRKPRFHLSCGHWICSTCVEIFYQQASEDLYLFNVDYCLICDQDLNTNILDGVSRKNLIRIIPDKDSFRVLSIDGGGGRGRGPLEFLLVLQQQIALPYLVQRHFNVIFGTSSGALITAALCFNGWSVEKCIEYFETCSKSAFDPHDVVKYFGRFHHIPYISTIFRFLVSLLADSKYSANKLEKIQKEVYGEHRSIVDSAIANEMGAAFGVTMTGVKDPTAFIATNYNGDNIGNQGEYEHIQFTGGTNSVPLWEILRCCTAAPYYFTPHEIKGAGCFQDGGLTKFNNPAPIALNEVKKLSKNKDPSIFVSLGTGIGRSSLSASGWKDWFPFRIARAFFKLGDSNESWTRFINKQEQHIQGQFFRFDRVYQDGLPALDDVQSMDKIAKVAHEAAILYPHMQVLADTIRAELFTFELDLEQLPRFYSGAYHCTGILRCLLGAKTLELSVFLEQLKQHTSILWCDKNIFHTFSPTDSNEYFFCKVHFQVLSRDQNFGIQLEESKRIDINGSPFTLDRLMRQQGANACFGTESHQKRSHFQKKRINKGGKIVNL